MKSFRIGLAALLALAPVSASALDASGSISLRATVPLVCNISVMGSGSYIDEDTVALGSVRELCNGANGYAVIVSYEPGKLVGATLRLGEDAVILDGSGKAVVSNVRGAAYRVRPLLLDAGANGIDSLNLSLAIQSRT